MAEKIAGMEAPSRRTVEMLFRDLLGYGRYGGREDPRWLVYRKIEDEIEVLREQLLDVPGYVELQRRKTEALARCNEVGELVKAKTRKVQKLYQSRGLTPAVVRQIQELVDWTNELDSKE